MITLIWLFFRFTTN